MQAIGDALAAIPLAPIPPLGGVADALLKPFYEDTIAAFMTVYLLHRAAGTSWLGPYEEFIPGADQAYTLSATMVLRTAIRATDTKFSASMEIVDGLPWRVGGEGLGDMRLGTRILMQAPVAWDDRIYSQRITKLQLVRDRDTKPTFKAVVGDIGPAEDGFTKQMQAIGRLVSAVSQLGVF
ncbi:hypothetical protein [Tomitella gaofuii]|uniref:Gp37-like protein n=1 Tax=Tomitella gaofuii TaxID=2760083 RepID=UPI0015F7EC72|nr:hypothetical protein [Tomitella gaofuii]